MSQPPETPPSERFSGSSSPQQSSSPLRHQYIAVDGPIGVGKTTLVELLHERFEGVKILEDVDNPFLGDFYK